MKIPQDQMNGLRKGYADQVRRSRLRDLSERGYTVTEDPGSGVFLLKDPEGGSSRVVIEPDSIALASGEGRSLLIERDVLDRMTALTDSSGLRTSYERDPAGRVIAIRRGAQVVQRTGYNRRGKVERISDAAEATTHYRYDAAGRVIAVTDRNGNTTHHRYTSDGRPARLIDARGFTTRFEYDGWSLPSAIVFPTGDRQAFRYGSDGRLRQVLDNGRPHATIRADEAAGTYDVRYEDGTRARLVFDKQQIVEATNETCTVRIERDVDGRILSEDTDGQVVRYLRNRLGALVGIKTPDGETLRFERDGDQNVSAIIDWHGNRYEPGHSAGGLLDRIDFPNGVSTALTHTPAGLMASLRVRAPGLLGKTLTSCGWKYDVRNRVTEEVRDGQHRTYRYDGEGRLLEAAGPSDAEMERFELDANGNRTRDAAGEAEFNGANQLIRHAPRRSESDSGAKDNYEYDSLGRMISGRCPTGPAQYTYNGCGQVTAVRTSRGVTRYAYDALGRRVRKESGGQVTRYVWAGLQLLSETTSGGRSATRRDYLFFPETFQPLAMRVDGCICCLHAGRRLEPLAMTDVDGRVVWQAEYSAFGEARVTTGRITQPLRLAGQYFDEETGLHYSLARYYDPRLGRFLSMDPLLAKGGSLNFYNYCDGDPINAIDPTGEFLEFAADVATAARDVAVGVAVALGVVAVATLGGIAALAFPVATAVVATAVALAAMLALLWAVDHYVAPCVKGLLADVGQSLGEKAAEALVDAAAEMANAATEAIEGAAAAEHAERGILYKEGRLIVIVRSPSGGPIQGAAVSAPQLGPPLMTDANGKANFGYVREGSYGVAASKKLYEPEAVLAVARVVAGELEVVELELTETGILRVTVSCCAREHDCDKGIRAPLPDIAVSIRGPDQHQGRTDANGIAEFRVEPGEYTVELDRTALEGIYTEGRDRMENVESVEVVSAVERVASVIIHRMTWDRSAAAEYATSHAYEDKGVGLCGQYVRLAVDAGFLDGTKTEPSGVARKYGASLEKVGFEPISINLGEYVPQTGDVVIFQDYPGQDDAAGHAQIYDGTQFVSDFKQNDPFYPSSSSKSPWRNVSYQVYRYPNHR